MGIKSHIPRQRCSFSDLVLHIFSYFLGALLLSISLWFNCIFHPLTQANINVAKEKLWFMKVSVLLGINCGKNSPMNSLVQESAPPVRRYIARTYGLVDFTAPQFYKLSFQCGKESGKHRNLFKENSPLLNIT